MNICRLYIIHMSVYIKNVTWLPSTLSGCLGWWVFVYIRSSLRSIQFVLGSCAHKRIVDIIKVYIERNNIQVEWIPFCKKTISPLFTLTFAKRGIQRDPRVYACIVVIFRHQTGIFGPTLHWNTHNGFLQIMHTRTFHIKNPSDAKLASLSFFFYRKWHVSMTTIVNIKKYKKLNILVHSSCIHNIGFWTYVLKHVLSNGVMTLMFQGQLIANIKILLKTTHLHSK